MGKGSPTTFLYNLLHPIETSAMRAAMRYGRGLCSRGLIVIVTGILLASAVPLMPSAAGEDATLELKVIGELEQYSGDYRLLVIGVLHDLVLTIPSAPDNVHVQAYYGTQLPSTQDKTNYYEWTYQSGTWADRLYGAYLNASRCTYSQGTYHFAIGIDENATKGLWSLIVSADDSEVWNEQIIAKDPWLGTGVQPADEIHMVVPPFSTSEVRLSSLYTVQALPTIVRPDGIVPVSVEAVCDPYSAYFSITNISEPLHVGDRRTLDIIFTPKHEWAPQRLTTQLILTLTEDTIPSAPPTEMVVIKEKKALLIRVVVEVKRVGYELLDMGNGLYVQYKRSTTLPWGERATLSLFLVGTETIDLRIMGQDITVESIAGGEKIAPDTLRLALTKTTEQEVNLTIYAEFPDVAAYVLYRITRSGVDEEPFYTEVRVGSGVGYLPPPPPWNPYVLLVLGALVLAAMLITLYYLKREKTRRRELAKKKGKRGVKR